MRTLQDKTGDVVRSQHEWCKFSVIPAGHSQLSLRRGSDFVDYEHFCRKEVIALIPTSAADTT